MRSYYLKLTVTGSCCRIRLNFKQDRHSLAFALMRLHSNCSRLCEQSVAFGLVLNLEQGEFDQHCSNKYPLVFLEVSVDGHHQISHKPQINTFAYPLINFSLPILLRPKRRLLLLSRDTSPGNLLRRRTRKGVAIHNTT